MSVAETIPTIFPASKTGIFRIFFLTMMFEASNIDSAGVT